MVHTTRAITTVSLGPGRKRVELEAVWYDMLNVLGVTRVADMPVYA